MKLKDLEKKIMVLEEEQRAQLKLAQEGKDDYAWRRYEVISKHIVKLRSLKNTI